MSDFVILIPGFAGSSLHRDSKTGTEVWVSLAQLALRNFEQTKLASDGITADPEVGKPLFVGEVLADYYRRPFADLGVRLGQLGYRVIHFPFDWRKRSVLSAQQLLIETRPLFKEGNTFTVVAHSFGGIVARMFWRECGLAGLQQHIRRIITVGTPHQGSYSAVKLACADNENLNQVLTIENLFVLGSKVPGQGKGKGVNLSIKEITARELADIALTWPALYELFPKTGGADSVGDPLREELYDRAWWSPPAETSSLHFDMAKRVLNPLLLSDETIPPFHVLTTIAGRGRPAPWKLLDPKLLPTGEAIGTTPNGDGTVTTLSALMPASRRYTVGAAHMDLMQVLTNLGVLVEAVEEERLPPDPVPPAVAVPGVFPEVLRGPPFPNWIGTSGAAPGCVLGYCNC